MSISPLFSLWLLIPVAGLLVAFSVWQIARHRTHSLLRGLWARRLAVALLLIGILLRPSLPGGVAASGYANANVFFVIDTTGSMSAEDYDGKKTRLEGVHADATALIKHLVGAHFSVLTFGTETYLELPLTTDSTAAQAIVDTLSPEMTTYARGTTISRPLEMLSQQLKNAVTQHPDRKNIVYYFGDGEQTVDAKPASFASIKSYITAGGVLGYGTASGGKMKVYYGAGTDSTSYITDYTGKISQDAISHIDETNLRNIATQMSVGYSHQTKPGDVGGVFAQIDMARLTVDSKDINTRQDIYWVFALAMTLLIGFELWNIRDLLRAGVKKR